MAYSDTASVQSIAGDYLYLRRPLPLNHLLHRRYRISGILSEHGGFGMTYRAVDTYRNLNLAVVVKENFPLGVAVRNPVTLALHPVPGMEDTYATFFATQVALTLSRGRGGIKGGFTS